MILLDKLDGTIRIDDIVLNQNTTNFELDTFINKYQISIHTTTTGSKFYTISNLESGDTSLQLLFYNGKLRRINIGAGINYIFPPFEITQAEKVLVKKKINSIGGKNNYPWGSVGLIEDIKAGSVSVLINYNQNPLAS
jgi:hypothetical protein